jgi:hypothetical protein
MGHDTISGICQVRADGIRLYRKVWHILRAQLATQHQNCFHPNILGGFNVVLRITDKIASGKINVVLGSGPEDVPGFWFSALAGIRGQMRTIVECNNLPAL